RPFAALVHSHPRVHADLIPLLVLVLELHHAIDHREQRVIGRPANVRSRVELGPALLHENAARRHELPGEPLYAEVLGPGIAAVAGGTDTLLVSHALPKSLSFTELHVGDFDLGERLAVSGVPPESG